MKQFDIINYEDIENLTYLYAREIITEDILRDIEQRCVKPPCPTDLIGTYLENSVHPFDVLRTYFRAAYEVGALTECVVQAREFAEFGLCHPLKGNRSDWKIFAEVLGENAETIVEDIISTLERVINDRLPSGLYFGTHPDDPACIGIWQFDENEEV